MDVETEMDEEVLEKLGYTNRPIAVRSHARKSKAGIVIVRSHNRNTVRLLRKIAEYDAESTDRERKRINKELAKFVKRLPYMGL